MSEVKQKRAIEKWARFAVKCGLVLTDAKLWESIRGQLKNRVSDVSKEVKQRYDDTTDRLERAEDAYQGRRNWAAPVASFLGGVGLGVGVGLLLAPASGEQTRSRFRGKVVALKKRAGETAPENTSSQDAIPSASTGTDGD